MRHGCKHEDIGIKSRSMSMSGDEFIYGDGCKEVNGKVMRSGLSRLGISGLAVGVSERWVSGVAGWKNRRWLCVPCEHRDGKATVGPDRDMAVSCCYSEHEYVSYRGFNIGFIKYI